MSREQRKEPIVVKTSKLFSRIFDEEQKIRTCETTKRWIGGSSGVGSACQLYRGIVIKA